MRGLYVCLLAAAVAWAECSWDGAPGAVYERTVDEYNDAYVHPLMQKLLERDFFKYYKVRTLLAIARDLSYSGQFEQIVSVLERRARVRTEQVWHRKL